MILKLEIVFLILFMLGYGKSDSEMIENVRDTDTIIADSTIGVGCIPKDTVTTLGTEIRYLHRKSDIKITWGNGANFRMYDSSYYCFDGDRSAAFVPKFYKETKNHLIMTNILWTNGGCDPNPMPLELYAIVLPKNRSQKAFEKDFLISCEGDYLFYGDSSQKSNIHILNLETMESEIIELKPEFFYSLSPTSNIRGLNIKSGHLYIKYELLDSKETIVERVYKIKV